MKQLLAIVTAAEPLARDDQGIPRGWVKVMKEAIRTVAPQFSTRRMVKEYVKLWGEALAAGSAV